VIHRQVFFCHPTQQTPGAHQVFLIQQPVAIEYGQKVELIFLGRHQTERSSETKSKDIHRGSHAPVRADILYFITRTWISMTVFMYKQAHTQRHIYFWLYLLHATRFYIQTHYPCIHCDYETILDDSENICH
jgi:hypothetical protein